ncbi:MAG TPA: HAD family hydrolase, partial [Candidatus Limnocylindrales bacterium]|nr:HAD family hydrolase [Candidatus Limnocylindrales bacterium]
MDPSPIDWAAVEALSFDCYGTLIDWEAGISATLRPLFVAVGRGASDDDLLAAYAAHEARLERAPWLPYRRVLAEALAAVCADHDVPVPPQVRAGLGGSVADWPAFGDSAAALARLRTKFELAVITNCDDDLFAFSDARLGRPFRWRVTAEQVHSYKPARRNFEVALERIGRPAAKLVHVA